MKTLLIITGPQGSGNHLFSKIFAQHPAVFSWSALNKEYWVAHDQEPFAEAWNYPFLLDSVTFNEYAVTSISCPYAYYGQTQEPKYQEFIESAINIGYKVKLAIIGRDQTVLQHQQLRVRDNHSYPRFKKHLDYLMSFNPVFLSTELLYLYREHYVRSLSKLLDFPVGKDPAVIEEILKTDPNAKYFHAAVDQPLDSLVRRVSGLNNKKAE
jgi:hypothetical protein